ncbi:hypothetical protein KEM54_001916 [Ascosphaera aggregata]|nr:hypothetical protein KEM54_001916 [Ascosphaera aggregata]
MPTELEEPSLFMRHQLLPVRDLKLLVRDYEPIAKNALLCLINLSSENEVLKELAEDDAFLETLLAKLTNLKEPHVNELSMLLANLAKSDSIKRLITLKRAIPKDVSVSEYALDQLMDCFIKGQDGGLSKTKAADRNYDYLSYFFADVSKFEEGRKYFTKEQSYDSIIPVTKLTVFTEDPSHIRRKGVASTLKNIAFEIDEHPNLLAESGVNVLPYILLPLAGPEEFSDEESSAMLPDLQLLPPDKARDSDPEILVTHLETLLLLTTTREGRDYMREVQVYPLIRECHLHVDDENVREACDRLVQILMRDEEGEGDKTAAEMEAAKAKAIQDGSISNTEDDEEIPEVAMTQKARLCPAIEQIVRTEEYPPTNLAVLSVEEFAGQEGRFTGGLSQHVFRHIANQETPYLLWLTDGTLKIRAVLKIAEAKLLPSKESVVRLQDYRLQYTADGRIAFLAIKRLERVGQVDTSKRQADDLVAAEKRQKLEGHPTVRREIVRPSASTTPWNAYLGNMSLTDRPLNLWTLQDLAAQKRQVNGYMCDVFGIVVELSTPKRIRIGEKRDLRIIDYSIPDGFEGKKGVKMSTFVDVHTFKPAIGTIGLFRCVKTHKFENLSLNSYKEENEGKEWFITDEQKLRGYGPAIDVDRMKAFQQGLMSRRR